MSNRISQYKGGSYGTINSKKKQALINAYTKRSLHNQAIIAASRAGGAPLATRGFKPMAVANNKEKKYFDSPMQSYGVHDDGHFILINVPVLGNDYNHRIGRKITNRSVYIRGSIFCNATADIVAHPDNAKRADSQICRMILFVDSQPNGAQPAVADLLNEVSPGAQLNPNNRDRFRIIKDKLFSFDPIVYQPYVAAAPGPLQYGYCSFNRTMYPIKMYKKLNIETIFNQGVGQVIGDINTNALYLFFIGSGDSGQQHQYSQAHISIRLRFDDS